MKKTEKNLVFWQTGWGGNKLFPFLAEMSSSRSDDLTQTTVPGDNCISQPFLRTKKIDLFLNKLFPFLKREATTTVHL